MTDSINWKYVAWALAAAAVAYGLWAYVLV